MGIANLEGVYLIKINIDVIFFLGVMLDISSPRNLTVSESDGYVEICIEQLMLDLLFFERNVTVQFSDALSKSRKRSLSTGTRDWKRLDPKYQLA